MTGRKLAAGAVGLLFLGASALSARGLFSLDQRPRSEDTVGTEETEPLPWPYCAPDVTRPAPAPTPWPTLPPEPAGQEWRQVLDPVALALVQVSSITPLGPHDVVPSMQSVEVRVRDVLWQTGFPTGSITALFPILPGTSVLVGERELWIEAGEVLTAGGQVVIGIVDAWPNGAYQVGYAIDANPEAPIFLGPSPFAERDTGQFRMFLDWEGNPLQSASPVELLVTWNAEMAAPPAVFPSSGPISLSWSRFWDSLTGEDFPMPGTAQWWANAPPQCRSLLDAPPGVLDALPVGEVFVRVPESWRGLLDAVLCPRMSLGSMGCAGLAVDATWPYLYFDEIYAVPGEPIHLGIALEKAGAISWVDRVVIGVIPFPTFSETGSMLVELDSSFSPGAYEDVVGYPETLSLATVRSISPQESEVLLSGMPQANRIDCSTNNPNC